MRWAWLRWLILLGLTLATTFHIIALAFENRLLLHPERCHQYAHFTSETSETVALEGGGLLVRLLPPAKDEDSTTDRRPILFCHGNAGNIDSISPLANGLFILGYDVHVLEYAGFGTAYGCHTETSSSAEPFIPSPVTMVRDLKNAWHLMPNKSDAILIGFSMGAGCVFQLMSELPQTEMPAQIVVANTYFSLPQLVQEIVRIGVLGALMRTQWTADAGLSRYRRDGHLLVIGTPDDELIPYRHSELIRDCAAQHHLNVKHLVLPGGGHVNSIFFHTGLWYRELLQANVFNRESDSKCETAQAAASETGGVEIELEETPSVPMEGESETEGTADKGALFEQGDERESKNRE
jgi:dienelactone hydrolase